MNPNLLQKSKFLNSFVGYDEIPSEISSTNLPNGILELNQQIRAKNIILIGIVTNSSKYHTIAEEIQKKAAEYLNTSKQKLKSAQNLKAKFKVKYNNTNDELKTKCEEDLNKINTAEEYVRIIQITSNDIRSKFNSIKDDFEESNKLLNKSNNLIQLLSKNVEIYNECKNLEGTDKCCCEKGKGENGLIFKDCHKKHIN